MLSAHMDTVPICVGSKPVVGAHCPRCRPGHGLGADDRAGATAILSAALKFSNTICLICR